MLDKMCRVSSCVWGCAWGRCRGDVGQHSTAYWGQLPSPCMKDELSCASLEYSFYQH